MIEDYPTIRDIVLSSNRLTDAASLLMESGNSVFHISRHPLDTCEHSMELNLSHADERASLGIRLGIDLLNDWVKQRKTIDSVRCSVPHLVIPLAWLSQTSNPSPPYVYVCLATSEPAFDPVTHPEAIPRKFESEIYLGDALSGLRTLFLAEVEVNPEEGAQAGGSWLVFPAGFTVATDGPTIKAG